MWPLGTIFKVKSDDGEETWKVDVTTDIKNGVISFESPFGQFLLGCIQGKPYKYQQPDGEKVEYEIIGIRLPEGVTGLPQPRTFEEITEKIRQGLTLSQTELRWLEDHKHFSTLAMYNELLYQATRQTTYAIQASKFWRKADNPVKAIEITENVVDREPPSMAALLTTRGGAFRDLKHLNEAKKCAQQAIELAPENYFAYNLLAAIYHDAGRVAEAENYFKKAQELGAPPGDDDMDF